MSSDITSKRLIAINPDEWVRWASNVEDASSCELVGGEFQFVRRYTDTLVRVKHSSVGEFLTLFEIQTTYSLKMPKRMRSYAALAEEVFDLPVYPVLINILPYGKEIPTKFESHFLGLRALQDYRVINLWEVEAETVLEQDLVSLIPFLPTMNGANEELIETAKARLVLDVELQSTKLADELEFALALFTEVIFGKEMTLKIFGGKMLDIIAQTSMYQEILGRGREEEIRKILLKQLNKRFGEIDLQTKESVGELSVEQAEDLAVAIFDFETVADLHDWLAKLQS